MVGFRRWKLTLKVQLGTFQESHFMSIYKIHTIISLKPIFYGKITEDGSKEAVPQILYGQYLILGAFGSYIF